MLLYLLLLPTQRAVFQDCILAISSSLYVLEQCFWIMFGRDISLVFRRRKERLMFVIKLCCVDGMALHGGGEKENDGSSQQEQQ